MLTGRHSDPGSATRCEAMSLKLFRTPDGGHVTRDPPGGLWGGVPTELCRWWKHEALPNPSKPFLLPTSKRFDEQTRTRRRSGRLRVRRPMWPRDNDGFHLGRGMMGLTKILQGVPASLPGKDDGFRTKRTSSSREESWIYFKYGRF